MRIGTVRVAVAVTCPLVLRSPATTVRASTTSTSASSAAWLRSKLAPYAELMPHVSVWKRSIDTAPKSESV